MRDAVFQEFFRRLVEAEVLVQFLHIGLRFDRDLIGVQLLFRRADGRGDDLLPQTAAPLHGDHAADGDLRKRCAARQNARIGLDAVLVPQPDVIRVFVRVVDLLIAAFLLHDEDRHAQPVNFIELLRRELGKVLDEQLHALSLSG